MDVGFFNPNRTANASAWRVLPNRWDFIAFPLIICLIAMAVVGFHETMAPIATLQTQKISLDGLTKTTDLNAQLAPPDGVTVTNSSVTVHIEIKAKKKTASGTASP